ncbi:DNA-binding protein [Kitasatospora sp. Ki12]
MTAARPAPPLLPPVYLPSDIAKALHRSEWWVKEQARRGRIPFSKPGGSYRFTAEHYAEILRIYESRPVDVDVTAPTAKPPRRRTAPTPEPVTHLKARTPRRARNSQSRNNAA